MAGPNGLWRKSSAAQISARNFPLQHSAQPADRCGLSVWRERRCRAAWRCRQQAVQAGEACAAGTRPARVRT